MPFIGKLMGVFKAMFKFIIVFLCCLVLEVLFFALIG